MPHPRLARHPGAARPRFDAWLHRLTVNACLDLLRLRRRCPIEVELSPIDSISMPDHSSAFEERELLDAALSRLDPGHRAMVALCHRPVGAVTFYDYDDPTCTPHVVTAGQGYVDSGRGHIGRNESGGPAADICVIMAPVEAAFRQELTAPGPYCSF